jgi:hypothetical protein
VAAVPVFGPYPLAQLRRNDTRRFERQMCGLNLKAVNSNNFFS